VFLCRTCFETNNEKRERWTETVHCPLSTVESNKDRTPSVVSLSRPGSSLNHAGKSSRRMPSFTHHRFQTHTPVNRHLQYVIILVCFFVCFVAWWYQLRILTILLASKSATASYRALCFAGVVFSRSLPHGGCARPLQPKKYVVRTYVPASCAGVCCVAAWTKLAANSSSIPVRLCWGGGRREWGRRERTDDAIQLGTYNNYRRWQYWCLESRFGLAVRR